MKILDRLNVSKFERGVVFYGEIHGIG